MPLSFPSCSKPDGRANFISSGSGNFWVRRTTSPVRIHPHSLPSVLSCTPGACSACPLAKLRLGQFPGYSNGPTVLSSYDCIVLVRWNVGVLPRFPVPSNAANEVCARGTCRFSPGREKITCLWISCQEAAAVRRWLTAKRASSRRLETPSLSKTLLIWCFTVCSLIEQRCAMSGFE
jgi:hypothetical protein